MKKETALILKEVWSILRPYKLKMCISLLISFFTAGICVIAPFMNKILVDYGIIEKNFVVIIQYTILIAFMYILNEIVSFFQSKLHTDIENDISYRLELQAFEHISKLKMNYFENNDHVEMISMVNSDIDQISQIANQDFLNMIVQCIKMIGCMIGLLLISPILSLWVFVFIVIRYFFMEMMLKKKKDLFSKELLLHQEMSFWYNDTLNGIKVIKLWNLYHIKKEEFKDIKKKIIVSNKKISTMYLKEDLFSAIVDAILSMVLYIHGALLLFYNHITVGELFTYIVYSQMVMFPIYSLIGFKLKLVQLGTKFEHFKSFLDFEEESLELSNKLPNEFVLNDIVFENVSMNLGRRKILDKINLEFFKGEKIALVGKNGAGKSTIIDLLLRFKKQDTGIIKINSIDIHSLDLEQYRTLFTVVEQDGFLFNSDVEENIYLGDFDNNRNSNNLEKSISWIMKSLYKLSDGLKTKTGNRASLLSGGEKQKVLLARALQKKHARILILDEPTSNYDINSEQEFNGFVNQTDSYDLVFVITHREEILSCMDKVILLEDGHISAFGEYMEIKNKIESVLDFGISKKTERKCYEHSLQDI